MMYLCFSTISSLICATRASSLTRAATNMKAGRERPARFSYFETSDGRSGDAQGGLCGPLCITGLPEMNEVPRHGLDLLVAKWPHQRGSRRRTDQKRAGPMPSHIREGPRVSDRCGAS